MKEVGNPWLVLVAMTLLVLSTIALFTRLQTFNDSHEFDVLIFVQSWPRTLCMEWKESNPDHVCTFPKQTMDWTVHGIWPSKLGTKGPNFCDSSVKFNVDSLKPIIDDLNEYWTDVKTGHGHSKHDLWKHEWTKHGTCALQLPSLDTELKFFKQALQWSKDYNMFTVLSAKGLKPGNQYFPSDFAKAIVDEIGRKPHIICTHDSKTGLPYIQEIRICFDKNFLLVDCDGTKKRGKKRESSLTNCPDKPIVFPKNVPSEDRTPPPEKPHQYLLNLYNSISYLKWFTL